MGIGSSLWALLGDGSRWTHDFTAHNRYAGSGGTVGRFRLNFLSRVRMFQRPFTYANNRKETGLGDRLNTGYFVWIRDTPTADTDLVEFQHASGGTGGSTNPRPQWKQLAAWTGHASPQITPTDLEQFASPNYQTGFIDNVGATRQLLSGHECDAVIWTQWSVMGPYAHTLWHYNPWAWFGTVPQVIVDIAMKCGIAREDISEAGFDTAHDAYDLTTGDSIWRSVANGGAMGNKFTIAAARIVGETCISMLLECARHSRDFYYTNEKGQLACTSFTRPPSLTISAYSAGIIGSVQWEDTDEYLFNVVNASWGSAARTEGDFGADPEEPGAGIMPFTVQDEDRCESYIGSKLSSSYTYAASVAKYGERALAGRKVTVTSMGRDREIEVAHYPYLLEPHTGSVQAMAPMQSWIASDGAPARRVTITQDFRALDWGIGAVITNLAVTPDGVVIPRALCVQRVYDFDLLTVESVLLQIPAL